MAHRTQTQVVARLLAVAAALVAIVALSASALAQPQPQHRFYGSGVTVDGEAAAAGTTISAWVDGEVVGSATTGADGSWYIDVDGGLTVAFSVGDLVAEGTHESSVGGQTSVALAVSSPPPPPADDCPTEDGMMEDGDSMMEDDSLEGADDSMMSDDCPEDGDGDGDETMEPETGTGDGDMEGEDEVTQPVGGSGGLADQGGLNAGLTALLALLAVAAVGGAGYTAIRLRNRV